MKCVSKVTYIMCRRHLHTWSHNATVMPVRYEDERLPNISASERYTPIYLSVCTVCCLIGDCFQCTDLTVRYPAAIISIVCLCHTCHIWGITAKIVCISWLFWLEGAFAAIFQVGSSFFFFFFNCLDATCTTFKLLTSTFSRGVKSIRYWWRHYGLMRGFPPIPQPLNVNYQLFSHTDEHFLLWVNCGLIL